MKNARRMGAPHHAKSTAALNPGSTRVRPEIWNLKLYVAGLTPDAAQTMANLKEICQAHLAGRYRIKVVDSFKYPKLARGEQILAVPTLVRRLPAPMRKIIGNLSDTQKVLIGLDLLQGTARR